MPLFSSPRSIIRPITRSIVYPVTGRQIIQAPTDPAVQHFADTGADGMRYTFAPGTVFIDAAGTQPAGELDPVGRVTDLSGNGYHMQQSSTAAKPTLKRTAGGVWYLESDGTKWMECPQLITLTDQWAVSWAGQYESHQNFFGPWRMLRDGGLATATSDNRLEEYTRTSRDRVLRSWTGAQGTDYSVNPGSEAPYPPTQTGMIAWANRRNGAGQTVGEIYAGTTHAAELVPLPYSLGTARLSLFRGYSGDIMEGRMYAFTFAIGGWNDETRQAINDYEAERLGIVV